MNLQIRSYLLTEYVTFLLELIKSRDSGLSPLAGPKEFFDYSICLMANNPDHFDLDECSACYVIKKAYDSKYPTTITTLDMFVRMHRNTYPTFGDVDGIENTKVWLKLYEKLLAIYGPLDLGFLLCLQTNYEMYFENFVTSQLTLINELCKSPDLRKSGTFTVIEISNLILEVYLTLGSTKLPSPTRDFYLNEIVRLMEDALLGKGQ